MKHFYAVMLLCGITFCFCLSSIAQQGVTIGAGNPPDPSAILDLSSTTKGFLLPRMTTTQRNAIVSPANGLMLYNTTTKCIQAYLPQTGWRDVVCDCQTPPVSTFSYNPNTPGINSNITFTPTTPGMNYSWTFQSGNPATSTAQSPVVQWANPGTYQVTLTVTDNAGCNSTSTVSITVSNCPSPGGNTLTFNYTGGPQTWTVPNCVFSVTIQASGAQGGPGNDGGCAPTDDGGLGGYAQGNLAVTPGQVLYIYVGEKPTPTNNGNGGWNGGGGDGQYGGGGGGASDVRVGGQALNNRVIVAGGGGGGNSGCPDHGTGGAGGGTNGLPGINGPGNTASPGGGGTQSTGGVAGGGGGNPGSLGLGGSNPGGYHIAGGGGGYYGGGSAYAVGGGGGSGYIGGVTGGSMQTGVRTGHGQVVLIY